MRGYLLDADVFIDAHRRYYPFDIRPDFWDWLERKHDEGFVFSIKKVYDELRASEDELSEWAKKMSMRKFFKEANDVATINKMEELRSWTDKEEFTKEAVDEFYGSANIFLVAYAKAHNLIVATNEVYDENMKKKVKIPNACKFIGVEYVNTFQLLRKVGGARSVIAGYLQKLKELTSSEGNYAYRGQKNAFWEVESGALRRLKEKTDSRVEENKPSKEDFIRYHENELLEPARMDGHGVEDGRELEDLELLAKLQHHGAATCLIDFTRNFFVAMWFACQSHKEEKKEEEKEEEKDGKIFILNTSDEKKFLSLEKKYLKEQVRSILKFQIHDEVASSKEITIPSSPEGMDEEDKKATSSKETPISEIPEPSWWHWSPHGLIQRILKQDSLFVFGQLEIKGDTLLQEIQIPKEKKKEILRELERLGITERALFKDLPGFAESHGHNKLLPPEYGGANYYLRKGDEAWQKRDV